MLQSTMMDPVLGLDVHLVAVPTPAGPVPTPLPNPFVGSVFDPVGLALGAALGCAFGSDPGIVLVNSMPATNTGTNVSSLIGVPHIPAPGPFVDPPSNDAELIFGALEVEFAGSYTVRLGDLAMSCSTPRRLPTSMVLAIPKGRPVLVMPPMVPDVKGMLKALVMRGVFKALGAGVRAAGRVLRFLGRQLRRWQRGSRAWAALSGRLRREVSDAARQRGRSLWNRTVCFVTGHPVDVVTGRVFTQIVDIDLPGPVPLRIERVYDSSLSWREGVLGRGWSHSLDQAVWCERGRVVYRAEDGREIEWSLPEPSLTRKEPRVGETLTSSVQRCSVTRTGIDTWEVRTDDQLVRSFGPAAPQSRRAQEGRVEAKLLRIHTLDGFHDIAFHYDTQGRLATVRDSAERRLSFEYDSNGRIVELRLPHPDGTRDYVHRRFKYDAEGDLVEVQDALGAGWGYAYQGHLLVQETDRVGFRFYFQYDQWGSSAKCIRTWGDGGVYDHVIDYDTGNRRTVVTNSLKNSTIYSFNELHQVVSIDNPLLGSSAYTYDDETGNETAHTDGSGRTLRKQWNTQGQPVEVSDDRGTIASLTYTEGTLTRMRTSEGEWRWTYDLQGRVLESSGPHRFPERFGWERGLLTWVESRPSLKITFEYSPAGLVCAIQQPDGTRDRFEYDRLGRIVEYHDSRNRRAAFSYDLEGRLLEFVGLSGEKQTFLRNAEGTAIQTISTNHRVLYGRTYPNNTAWREEGDARIQFQHDSEDNLIGVINEVGERSTFERNEAGHIIAATAFDGSTYRYKRDTQGRPLETFFPSNRSTKARYDQAGRLVEARNSDGSFAKYEYDTRGFMVRAENESCAVLFERDSLGRITKEVCEGHEVRSRYELSGSRSELTTTLGNQVSILRTPSGALQSVFLGTIDFSRIPDLTVEHNRSSDESVWTFRNGVEVHWAHDASGRPIARRLLRHQQREFVQQLPHTTAGQSRPREEVSARTFTWTGEDQLFAILDSVTGPSFQDYDEQGHLIRQRTRDTTLNRPMDAVGNVYKDISLQDRRYGTGGRLEERNGIHCDYDLDGNLIRKIGSDGEWQYRWNGHGRLIEVIRPDRTKILCKYDPFGRRIQKDVHSPEGTTLRTTRYVWDDSLVIHEIDSEQGLTTWHWVPGTYIPIAKDTKQGRVYISTDHLGTPAEMHTASGEILWQVSLNIWGVPSTLTGDPQECPWRWSGQYEDRETGLYYNHFRYYDPEGGTYLSRDPLGLAGGLNAYRYVADPATQIDPLGLIELIRVDILNPEHLAQYPELNQMIHGPRGYVSWINETIDRNAKAPPRFGRSTQFFMGSSGDVGVIRLTNSDGIVANSTRASLGLGPANHAEPQLLHSARGQTGESSGIITRVRALYSEIIPCDTHCRPLVEQSLPDDTRVFWSFPHDQSPETLRARLAARAAACKR